MPITTICPTSRADVDVHVDNAAVLVDEDRCAFVWRCLCGELHSRTIEPGTAANLVADGVDLWQAAADATAAVAWLFPKPDRMSG